MKKGVPRWAGVKGRHAVKRHPCRKHVGVYVQRGRCHGAVTSPDY